MARRVGTGSVTSVSVEAAAGERWRIYAVRSADGATLETSVCAGSVKLAAEGRADAGNSAPAAGSSESPTTRLERSALAFAAAILVVAISTVLVTRRSRSRSVPARPEARRVTDR